MTACGEFAIVQHGEGHQARIGRGLLRPTPACRDMPPSPSAGEYPAYLVAIVNPGEEQRAQAWLWHRAKVRTWLPTAPVYRTRGAGRSKIKVREPITRGYLLVPALYLDHAAVLAAPGIHSYLRLRDLRLAVVPDAAFDGMRKDEQDKNKSDGINPETGQCYRPGDLVDAGNRMIGEVIASVEEVDESGRASLSAGSFRITTSVAKLKAM